MLIYELICGIVFYIKVYNITNYQLVNKVIFQKNNKSMHTNISFTYNATYKNLKYHIHVL